MEATPHKLKTLQEAIKHFSDINTCLEFLIPFRWPNGITCPNCQGVEHSFLSTRHVWKCKSCKKQFSIKQGTIMEDSPLGLDKWMVAIWMVTNAKNGISSWEIHRTIGITQKSAWFLAHRIRLALDNGSFIVMSGQVEADETFVGGLSKNMHHERREELIQGRGGVGKAIVMGILERHETKGASQVMATVIPDRSADTLQEQIYSTVEPGSAVSTDEWTGYNGLNEDYAHSAVNHSAGKYVIGDAHTNGMENFWTLFKRCVKGTWVSVEDAHLHRYVTEQEFRFNERKGKDGDRFIKSVSNIGDKRLTYKQLIERGSSPVGRRGRLPQGNQDDRTETNQS